MKKKYAMMLIALGTLIASCKKDYTCTCTLTLGGMNVGTQDFVYEKVSKKDAKSRCSSNEATITGFGSTTCRLK